MSQSSRSLRVGRVVLYRRSQVWYLRYHESGKRRQQRGAKDLPTARRLAAEINSQLESGTPTALGYEAISPTKLRKTWLEHHDMVRRSSTATISRYRTATDHLLRFVHDQPIKQLSQFRIVHAEAFVRHLRQLKVAPNGHKNTEKRPLRDKGVKFVLECCRAMFNFAMKRRHLPPYSENPFSTLEVQRIPLEDAKPIQLFKLEEERQFFERCDEWQLPIFATLALTGMRVGELVHLVVEDVDLAGGWLLIQNKPELGWRIKTRNERQIPLLPELGELLRRCIGDRTTGPVFLRRRFLQSAPPQLASRTPDEVAAILRQRIESSSVTDPSQRRTQEARLAKLLWIEMGALKPDRLRKEFMSLTRSIGRTDATAPKLFRHAFATLLQDARVDVLIRNQVMGHAPADGAGRLSGGLGMTGWYTHTKEETYREQICAACEHSSALAVMRDTLQRSCAQAATALA
jgi:integrase